MKKLINNSDYSKQGQKVSYEGLIPFKGIIHSFNPNLFNLKDEKTGMYVIKVTEWGDKGYPALTMYKAKNDPDLKFID